MREMPPAPCMPIAVCRPSEDDLALLYYDGIGFAIGRFVAEHTVERRGTGTVTIEDHWSIDCYPTGDQWKHADPKLIGFFPLRDPGPREEEYRAALARLKAAR